MIIGITEKGSKQVARIASLAATVDRLWLALVGLDDMLDYASIMIVYAHVMLTTIISIHTVIHTVIHMDTLGYNVIN
jgi:hypothetical protein